MIAQVAGIGAGVMGAGIAAQVPMPACPWCCSTSSGRRGRHRAAAEDRPGAPDASSANAAADHARQYRGRSRPAGRMRLDRRGGRRAARGQARRSIAKLAGRAEAGLDRLAPTPRPSRSQRLVEGHAGESSPPTSSSRISSTRRATCACWRRGRRPGDAARGGRARIADFGDRALGKARDPLQGHAGLHRQPHRRLLDPGARSSRRSISA